MRVDSKSGSIEDMPEAIAKVMQCSKSKHCRAGCHQNEKEYQVLRKVEAFVSSRSWTWSIMVKDSLCPSIWTMCQIWCIESWLADDDDDDDDDGDDDDDEDDEADGCGGDDGGDDGEVDGDDGS